MRRPIIVACIASCVCATPLPALAQTIYKVQMPDGSILFTDTPPPEAKVLEERTSKATPPRAPAGKTVQTPLSPPPPGTPKGTVNKLDTAAAEITAAERDLTIARRKLELGREPLPGERLGLKGGGTRLSPEYEARVSLLEQDVAAAEARLRRAHDARNAAR
jgi:hypothetical protein